MISATQTFYDNNEMWFTGTLTYVGSSTGGAPVNNLADGRIHKIYLNGESERCLAIEPFITNMKSETVEGWIDSGYKVSIPLGQELHVTQPLYASNNTQRNGTAYYEVSIEEIQTGLLFRQNRQDTYITFISIGIILIGIFTIFKRLRND